MKNIKKPRAADYTLLRRYGVITKDENASFLRWTMKYYGYCS